MNCIFHILNISCVESVYCYNHLVKVNTSLLSKQFTWFSSNCKFCLALSGQCFTSQLSSQSLGMLVCVCLIHVWFSGKAGVCIGAQISVQFPKSLLSWHGLVLHVCGLRL